MTRHAEKPLDVDEIRLKWLKRCGPCDLGLNWLSCNHPSEDYRPVMWLLVREVLRLRNPLGGGS